MARLVRFFLAQLNSLGRLAGLTSGVSRENAFFYSKNCLCLYFSSLFCVFRMYVFKKQSRGVLVSLEAGGSSDHLGRDHDLGVPVAVADEEAQLVQHGGDQGNLRAGKKKLVSQTESKMKKQQKLHL